MAELAVGHTVAQVCAHGVDRHAAVTGTCLDWGQGILMRFSSIFHFPARPQQRPVQPERGRTPPVAEKPSAVEAEPDLPEELDARVRLVGEWQLGEG
jgi:hypothetical protein